MFGELDGAFGGLEEGGVPVAGQKRPFARLAKRKRNAFGQCRSRSARCKPSSLEKQVPRAGEPGLRGAEGRGTHYRSVRTSEAISGTEMGLEMSNSAPKPTHHSSEQSLEPKGFYPHL